MPTHATTKKKPKAKVDKSKLDNGPTGAAPTAEEPTRPLGKHIEIPESAYYSMDLKRKQNNDKMFLNLMLPGAKDKLNFRIKLESLGYDMPVKDLVAKAIKSMGDYLVDYSNAQKRATEQTPSLEDFFF